MWNLHRRVRRDDPVGSVASLLGRDAWWQRSRQRGFCASYAEGPERTPAFAASGHVFVFRLSAVATPSSPGVELLHVPRRGAVGEVGASMCRDVGGVFALLNRWGLALLAFGQCCPDVGGERPDGARPRRLQAAEARHDGGAGGRRCVDESDHFGVLF